MENSSRIFIAGHRSLVGSAIRRELERKGYTKLLLKTRSELDLLSDTAVANLFAEERPDYVFLAAAKVGGILANDTYPADFIRDNLEIQTNVIDAAYRSGVKRLLFLGSSCIYPRLCPQPIKEEYRLTGPLEATNRAYALAKIAGIEMCWPYNGQYWTKFLAAMPTNLYGPGDNLDLNKSHVLPALIRKATEAKASGGKKVTVWGTQHSPPRTPLQ
jgi:GDP-L-fucose synthase